MNLYLITQTINLSHSAYRAAVVCSVTPEQAARIHPGGKFWNDPRERGCFWWQNDHHTGRSEIDESGFWVKPEHVHVEALGSALPDYLPTEGIDASLGMVVCARTAEASEKVETFAQTEGRAHGGLLDRLRENLDKVLDERGVPPYLPEPLQP